MARKKAAAAAEVQNEENIINEEAKTVEAEPVVDVVPTEKTQLEYIMDVVNDQREECDYKPYIWNGIEIKIKHSLNIYEMKVLFDQIVERCFSTADGEYQPEYQDFAERAAIVAMYSDINMPAEVYDQYDLVFKTDIYRFVTDRIDSEQLWAIIDSVSEKIKERVNYKAQDVLRRTEEAVSAIESLTSMFQTTFDGVDAESLSGVIKSISEHGIDEGKIVDAVINKTDGAVN